MTVIEFKIFAVIDDLCVCVNEVYTRRVLKKKNRGNNRFRNVFFDPYVKR